MPRMRRYNERSIMLWNDTRVTEQFSLPKGVESDIFVLFCVEMCNLAFLVKFWSQLSVYGE